MVKLNRALISLSLIFSSFFSHTVFTEPETELFEATKQLYLKSFPVQPEESLPETDKKKLTLQIRNLPDREQREIVFDLFGKKSFQDDKKDTFVDRTLLKNLEIFCGGEESQNHLFNIIKRTKTVAGEAALAGLLSRPVFDITTMQQRQETIQELLDYSELFEELDQILNDIKKIEPIFLSYWEKDNPVNEEIFKKVYFGNFLDRFNKNSYALEMSTRINNLLAGLVVANLPLTFGVEFGIGEYIGAQKAGNPISKTHAFGRGLKKVGKLLDPRLETFKNNNATGAPKTGGDLFYAIDHGPQNALFTPFQLKAALMGGLACLIGLQAYQSYDLYNKVKLEVDIAKHLQAKLISVASYVENVKKLYSLVDAHPSLHKIISFEEFNFTGSDNFNKLLKMLNHNTFKGNPSIFSLTGRVLAAHKIMKEVKDEFIPCVEIVGKVDAYLSITKLYQDHESKPARYSFAQFVDHESPFIEATNFWNPFIKPEDVVCNSLTLGIGKPNNIILTGPNTGGKSTVIKGLQLNVLFAQTFGIVPAEKLILTPFAVINCSLNVADDISAGVSLFKAEVLRAKGIMERIRKLLPHQFSFTIMDEVFSGTSPVEGEQAALRYAKALGSCPNSLCSIATHFPLMPDLEKESNFKNYQVMMYKAADGTLIRPFKLQDGRSDLNVAMDLLEQEGIFSF